jgi:hypothetical protein
MGRPQIARQRSKDIYDADGGSESDEPSGGDIGSPALIPAGTPPSAPAPLTTSDTAFYSRYKADFIELGMLGRGGFGQVWKCRNKASGSRAQRALAAADARDAAGLHDAPMRRWMD